MYALAYEETTESRTPRSERLNLSVPYCFILDERYRVVMAGPSGGDDPLTELYEADSQVDVLPVTIDRVVRALTAAWGSARTATTVTASLSDLQVTVAPLHGYEGRKIAVFVQRIEGRRDAASA
ncbi:MAG TPA: hypothetical protein VGN11_02750 [Candidatus Baltobacteraceae bacterium]|nr:hypothetical protein [Candidatus Baltobacteraceae bacterium]